MVSCPLNIAVFPPVCSPHISTMWSCRNFITNLIFHHLFDPKAHLGPLGISMSMRLNIRMTYKITSFSVTFPDLSLPWPVHCLPGEQETVVMRLEWNVVSTRFEFSLTWPFHFISTPTPAPPPDQSAQSTNLLSTTWANFLDFVYSIWEQKYTKFAHRICMVPLPPQFF